jgi:uncharacterized repeat protein (TIGR01451 family)/LPXTG-motif cell wall-anchored protein
MRPVRVAVIALLSGLALSPLLAATPAYAGINFDVSIAKSHTGNFTVGENGTFTITLHNSGANTGSDTLTVTDTLPAGLTYVSDTGAANGLTCNANGQTVTCSGAPNMSNGADLSFTLTVSVHEAARPSADNTVVFADSAQNDTNADNNTDTDTVTVDPAPTTTPSPTGSPSPSQSPSQSESPSPTASVAGETAQLPTTGGSTGTAVVVAVALLVMSTVGYSVVRKSRRAH